MTPSVPRSACISARGTAEPPQMTRSQRRDVALGLARSVAAGGRSRSSAPRRRTSAARPRSCAHQRLGLQEPVRHDEVGPGHEGGVRECPTRWRGTCGTITSAVGPCATARALSLMHDGHASAGTSSGAVDDALRVAGRAARVAHRGGVALVDVGPVVRVGARRRAARRSEHELVAAPLERRRVAVAGDDDVLTVDISRQHRRAAAAARRRR